MAQLIVRQIDDEIVRQLQIRAADRGRSAEAEHRAILEEVLGQEKTATSLKDHLASTLRPKLLCI